MGRLHMAWENWKAVDRWDDSAQTIEERHRARRLLRWAFGRLAVVVARVPARLWDAADWSAWREMKRRDAT
jgi:hypothetical protein